MLQGKFLCDSYRRSGPSCCLQLCVAEGQQMLQFQLVVVHLALVIALLWWNSSSVLLAQAAPEPLEPPAALGVGDHPIASEEKSATNLAAKLFLLDDLVSLENEVTETKKKRSFPGFGSPIDRISSSSVDAKGKQSMFSLSRQRKKKKGKRWSCLREGLEFLWTGLE
ncbi:osteocrin isoform X3 [Zonotrichia leucophrys gambelii]|uniref:osteocrin isoform X3 n=1 Tax=Zonotrichia leucophrys gambelii TaxID=257770 RepID=UPI00313FF46D